MLDALVAGTTDPEVLLLCTILGVKQRTAEATIAEIGTDMSVFPTAGHLA
jgi:transposase